MTIRTLCDTDSVQIIANKWLEDVRQYQTNVDTLFKHGTINAALANIGTATLTTIVVTENTAVNANTDLTSYPNIQWLFLGSGKLTPAVGVTLTLYSPNTISALPSQFILDGTSGTITFANPGRVYPQWYGAISATNNYTIIQAALNSGAGNTIYFTPGAWPTANVTVSLNNQRIVGAGWSSVVQVKDANQPLFSVNDGVEGLEIAHLKLKDTGTFDAGARGRALIYCNPGGGSTGVKKINVHHCWLANGAISGISGNKILDSHFHHNLVDADGGACGEHGIYCSSGSQRVTIDHNTMISSGTSNGAGITSNATADYSVGDITCDTNIIKGFQWGISPASTSGYKQAGWTIANNTVIGTSDSTESGIDLFSVILERSTITGNTVRGFVKHGFRNDGLIDSVVSNNVFTQNLQCGMILRGTKRCVFSGNLFRDNDYDGNGTTEDDSSGLRLLSTSGMTDNYFIGNMANCSAAASYQKYGISVGSGTSGNFFLNNVASSNRTADLSVSTGNFWSHVTSTGTRQFGDLGGTANVDYATLINASGQLTPGGQASKVLAGSGTPEASVTAPVGSIYLRTNGGAGTSLYVKESGSGNTGWVGK